MARFCRRNLKEKITWGDFENIFIFFLFSPWKPGANKATFEDITDFLVKTTEVFMKQRNIHCASWI